jgi:hypothetical protein
MTEGRPARRGAREGYGAQLPAGVAGSMAVVSGGPG